MISWTHPVTWLAITAVCLVFCTFLPIRIKDDRLRQWVSWLVLIPISLLLILYAYPAGIEVFRNFAIQK